MRNYVMCDRCKELDKKIEHYRQIATKIPDELLIAGVCKMIEEMEAEKEALHPEEPA
jgi:hypothetical protein